MDGVLVDTEPIYFELNQFMFKHFGFQVSAEEHNSFVGYPTRKIWTHLSDSRNKPVNLEELKIPYESTEGFRTEFTYIKVS